MKGPEALIRKEDLPKVRSGRGTFHGNSSSGKIHLIRSFGRKFSKKRDLFRMKESRIWGDVEKV